MSEVRVAVLVGVAVTEGGLEGASGAYLVILSVLMTGPHCENSHSLDTFLLYVTLQKKRLNTVCKVL